MEMNKVMENRARKVTKYCSMPHEEIVKELTTLENFLIDKEISPCPSDESKIRKGWLMRAEQGFNAKL